MEFLSHIFCNDKVNKNEKNRRNHGEKEYKDIIWERGRINSYERKKYRYDTFFSRMEYNKYGKNHKYGWIIISNNNRKDIENKLNDSVVPINIKNIPNKKKLYGL